jgi:FAS-associated factor 2
MADSVDDKVSYFQAVTGIADSDLCTEILAAHNWDLQLAVSSITANPSSPSASSREAAPSAPLADAELVAPPPPQQYQPPPPPQQQPGIAWKLVTLPFYVVSGGVGLIAGTVRLGAWVAGGVLSRSLSLLGLAAQGGGDRLLELPPSAAEAADFIAEIQREFGAGRGPRFVAEGFADAFKRAQREYKLIFVYLHSPDHPDTPAFCGGCLCAEPVAAFIDENFVAWGGSVRRTEGFKMSNSLNASRFPFCAVVMASTNQRIVLLQQVCYWSVTYFYLNPHLGFNCNVS